MRLAYVLRSQPVGLALTRVASRYCAGRAFTPLIREPPLLRRHFCKHTTPPRAAGSSSGHVGEPKHHASNANADAVERDDRIVDPGKGGDGFIATVQALRKVKLKTLWEHYGLVGVSTYFGVYVPTITGLFFAYDTGVLSAPSFIDMQLVTAKLATLMDYLHFPDATSEWVKDHPKTPAVLMAWATAKVTEPLRFVFTVWVTPKLARALGYAPPVKPGQASTTKRVMAAGAELARRGKNIVKAAHRQKKNHGAGPNADS